MLSRSFFKVGAALLIFSFVGVASAERRGPPEFYRRVAKFSTLPVDNHQEQGQRTFDKGMSLANPSRGQGLPHFTVTGRDGSKRLVINVHGEANLRKYVAVFSERNRFMEHTFNASKTSEPHWSYLRIDKRMFKKYGAGESYSFNTNSTRIAFPYSTTKREFDTRKEMILNTPAPPFLWESPYPGGIHVGKWQSNCTDWVCSVNGKLTMGRKTNAVLDHAGSLWSGGHTPRMRVMAVITSQPIENFDASYMNKTW